LESEVREAFLDRPRLVENMIGFRGIEVLTDASDSSIFLLLTRWVDENSFRVWHRSEAHHQSHASIPRGLKLDAAFTSLTIGNSIANGGEILGLEAALEGQLPAIARWLKDSDSIFALLLAADGTILFRNRAGQRIFPADSQTNFDPKIWDYLVCSDTDPLRKRLAGSGGKDHDHLLLNLADGQQNPITFEVDMIPCNHGTFIWGPKNDDTNRASRQRFKNCQMICR
jgi:hypothetical protein